MNFEASHIITAFVAMGAAIVALSIAVATLWRSTEKRFVKLDAELKKAIKERCIRGGGEPRPCLNRNCISDDSPVRSRVENEDFVPQAGRRFMDPQTSGDGYAVIRKAGK